MGKIEIKDKMISLLLLLGGGLNGKKDSCFFYCMER